MIWNYPSFQRTDNTQKDSSGIQELESMKLKSKVKFHVYGFESEQRNVRSSLRLSVDGIELRRLL